MIQDITMGFEERYQRAREAFLNDERLCIQNRELFTEYFRWQERKLKSINNLRALDEGCYKTLYHYICMFKNVIKWFNYRPLREITKEDIKKVYEDLEDGKLLNSYGKPFEDRASYYGKIFKGKLFKMIRKNELAEEVLEFSRPEKNKGKVRFFTKDDFEKMSMVATKISHKLMLQLCWDIGENIMTILQLQKKDCQRTVNENTNEPEYLINLPREKIKRSRTSRTELTNYRETVELLDLYFERGKRFFIPDPNGKDVQNLRKSDGVRKRVKGNWKTLPFEDNDYLFDFGHKQAEKVFRRITNITGVKCQPNGERPTLKDLRSSMACHLLKQGWSIEEVKGRMGHKPSSKAIDRYVTFLALDKHKPKQRMYESSLKKYKEELAAAKSREKLHKDWADNHQQEIQELKSLMQIYIRKFQQIEQLCLKDSPQTPVYPEAQLAVRDKIYNFPE